MILIAFWVIFLTYFIYKKISMSESVAAFAKAVPGPPMKPLIGNLTSFLTNDLKFSELFQKNWEKYGNRFRLIIVNQPVLVSSDVKDLEVIFNNTPHKADTYHLMKPFLGSCILVNSDDEARKKRKILVPTFHAEVLSNYMPILEKCIKKFLIKMESKKQSFNISDLTQLFTLDVLSEAAMGVEVNAMDQEGSDFVVAFKKLVDCFEIRWKNVLFHSNFFYFNFTEYGRTERKVSRILIKFSDDIIAARRKIVEAGEVFIEGKKISFLDALLTAKDENGEKLSDEYIGYEVRIMLIAGHDTTFSTLSFMTHEIGNNPDVQEKIVKEQLEIFGDNQDKIASIEEVQKMKYLEMVIKETLRMYPSAPLFGRKTEKNVQFDGFILPKGSNVFVNLYSMGRNPEIFPDPSKFDPERFNPDSAEYKTRHTLASIPFSYGPRSCLGQAFATWEMKSLFSSVIRKYKISLTSKQELQCDFGLTLKPKGGLYVNIEKR